MLADDLDSADAVMRLAFGTIRGLPDPKSTFGDTDIVHTRFRSAPDCAWVAELEGDVVGVGVRRALGLVRLLRPAQRPPRHWDRGIGGRLLQPVLAAFTTWDVRQAGLFTFADSLKHLGLYQKHGFWPGALTVVTAEGGWLRSHASTRSSRTSAAGRGAPPGRDPRVDGSDLSADSTSSARSRRERAGNRRHGSAARRGTLEGMAVCHCGAGSEAGGDTCYVKFAAVLPGERRRRCGSSASSTRARPSRRSRDAAVSSRA